MEIIEAFSNIADIFAKYGYKVYLVGGSVRDYLLKVSTTDLDLCTDATPTEMEEFLPDANFRFAKFGTVSFHFDIYKVEVTTLRKEDEYADYRHPKNIKFVTTPEEDFTRRDFTINALYLDRDLNVYDFTDGLKDLKRRKIKMIGDPNKRIIEDPLRILRALRFKVKLGFDLDETLVDAINQHLSLLNNLNQDKVKHEIRKMMKLDEEASKVLLKSFGIPFDEEN